MKRANVVAWALAYAAGVAACGRQPLDLAPQPSGAAAGVGGAAGAGGASGAGAAPPRARVTVVVADHLLPGSFGRNCTDTSECSWWQDPDPALICCGGMCATTAGDPQNCGACGHACAHGEICTSGKCGRPTPPAMGDTSIAQESTLGADCNRIACAAGQLCCNGACVDPQWNGNNCGACGVACRYELAGCAYGTCCPAEEPDAACHSTKCDGLLVSCADGCKDLGTDPNNCGACGAVCPISAPMCVSGLCLGGPLGD